MRTNALSVANYFIERSHKDGKGITPLKLMKLVYIAYGFGLAVLDRVLIDYRFDHVEAWKLGPVIPSVYHSFKIYGKSNIEKPTTMLVGDDFDFTVVTPKIDEKDDDAISTCEFVWKRYGGCDGSTLVSILHGKGTPWGQVYQEGRNNPIPETLTRLYYKELVERLKRYADEHGR